MGYYKIKNITNLLPKRHAKLNTTQSFEIKNDKLTLEPNGECALECNFLPISLHKLRAEGVVSVIEIDKNTFIKISTAHDKAKAAKVKPAAPKKEVKKVEESSHQSFSDKKNKYRKEK